MPGNQDKKTMLSLISSLIALAMSFVINFFMSPYIVSNFGAEANGFTQLANNFVNYATLITIALNSMAGRFITISYHKKNYDMCNKYYSSVIIGNIAIIALLIIPAVCFVFKLDNILNIETANIIHVKILFGLVFANFFVSQISGIFSIVFYVKNSQYISNTLAMVRILLNALGLVFLFSVFLPRIYYVSLIGFLLSCVMAIVYFVFKRKLLPEVKFSIRAFDIKTVWEMVSSGIWNTVNQCGNILMTGLDLLLSNLFISPVQMGVLSIAKTIPNVIVQLGTTVNSAFSPNLTIAYAEGSKDKILGSLRYAMKCSSILTCIPIVILFTYGNSFYSLWMPTMDATQLTKLSFLSCMMFIPLSGVQVLYNVFTTTNKLKINSVSVVAGGFVNFIIVYILLRSTNLGLYAVASVSSVVSIVRNLVITVPYTAKLLGLKWYTFYKDVLISCLISVIMIFISFIVRQIILPYNWLLLIISVVIACIASLFVSLFVLLNKGEREGLKKRFLRRN